MRESIDAGRQARRTYLRSEIVRWLDANRDRTLDVLAASLESHEVSSIVVEGEIVRLRTLLREVEHQRDQLLRLVDSVPCETTATGMARVDQAFRWLLDLADKRRTALRDSLQVSMQADTLAAVGAGPPWGASPAPGEPAPAPAAAPDPSPAPAPEAPPPARKRMREWLTSERERVAAALGAGADDDLVTAAAAVGGRVKELAASLAELLHWYDTEAKQRNVGVFHVARRRLDRKPISRRDVDIDGDNRIELVTVDYPTRVVLRRAGDGFDVEIDTDTGHLLQGVLEWDRDHGMTLELEQKS